MTQIITGKHKTPEEIVALYRERRPGMTITEAMARDTAGIEDENASTPPELIEAINAYNQTLPQKEELDDDAFDKYDSYDEMVAHISKKQTAAPQPTKTAISDSERENIIANFRASYPFQKNVTDDEIINSYLKEPTVKDSNTLTAQSATKQISKPQTIPLTNSNSNTLTQGSGNSENKIYQWACQLTTEQNEDTYHWTEDTSNLYRRLISTN